MHARCPKLRKFYLCVDKGSQELRALKLTELLKNGTRVSEQRIINVYYDGDEKVKRHLLRFLTYHQRRCTHTCLHSSSEKCSEKLPQHASSQQAP